MTKKETKTVDEPKVHDVAVVAEEKQKNEIAQVIENKSVTSTEAFGKLTRPQIDLMKRTIAKGASDDELKLFIQVCKGANLNPFLKQVFLVPRWDSKEGREVRAIQVSIDGFRSIAEESGQYAGNDDPIFDGTKEVTYKTKEKVNKLTVPEKATVKVYKIIGGLRCEFSATARWDEYYPGEKMGFQWHQRPYLMLGKCAEALALRKAFPKLLSGMYAQEELDKTIDAGKESQKVETGFKKLMSMIDTATPEQLTEYKDRISASDKYTDAQKNQFIKAVEKKLSGNQ